MGGLGSAPGGMPAHPVGGYPIGGGSAPASLPGTGIQGYPAGTGSNFPGLASPVQGSLGSAYGGGLGIPAHAVGNGGFNPFGGYGQQWPNQNSVQPVYAGVGGSYGGGMPAYGGPAIGSGPVAQQSGGIGLGMRPAGGFNNLMALRQMGLNY
jgi:hypothetical protein